MLSIRLSRRGKKKQPTYRVIVIPKHKDPWSKYTEDLGYYNPRTKEVSLKVDRIKYWIGVGAQPSDTVWNLFVSQGIIEGKKRTSTSISKKRLAREKKSSSASESEDKNESKKEIKEEATDDKEKKEEKSAEEPKKEEVKEDTKVEEKNEAPKEEVKEEPKEEEKTEEAK